MAAPNQETLSLWLFAHQELQSYLPELRKFLSPEEMALESQFRQPHQRESFVISRAGIRLIASSLLNVRPEQLSLQKTPQGKPYLIPQEALFFSLSHTPNYTGLVFSSKYSVGIDLEEIAETISPELDWLIEDLLPSEEFLRIQSLSPSEKQESFLHFWTQKEALLKAFEFDVDFLERNSKPIHKAHTLMNISDRKGLIGKVAGCASGLNYHTYTSENLKDLCRF